MSITCNFLKKCVCVPFRIYVTCKLSITFPLCYLVITFYLYLNRIPYLQPIIGWKNEQTSDKRFIFGFIYHAENQFGRTAIFARWKRFLRTSRIVSNSSALAQALTSHGVAARCYGPRPFGALGPDGALGRSVHQHRQEPTGGRTPRIHSYEKQAAAGLRFSSPSRRHEKKKSRPTSIAVIGSHITEHELLRRSRRSSTRTSF